jgi:uncharacterized protein (DUF58 family)
MASEHARRCLTLAAAGLLVGFALGQPALIALAAVPVAYLVIPSRHRLPVQGRWTLNRADRCFEDEPVPVEVTVALPRAVDSLSMWVRPGRNVAVTATPTAAAGAPRELRCTATVTVPRWGRRQLGDAMIVLSGQGGLRRAVARINLGEVAAFPSPAPLRQLPLPAVRHDQVGEHVARRTGPGVEFAAVRPFVFGDQLSRINWPATLRNQQLQVTQTAAERAVDVVIVLDCFDDVGPAGRSSLDLTVRAATGIARLVLAGQDRVGVVALGGWLRWVRPDVGTRQFYRVADAMLDVIGRESFVNPDLARVAPGTLPSGCVVLVVSPLLDERARDAAHILRSRGHRVVVVDVLTVDPPARGGLEELGLRLWRLTRETQLARLAAVGVPVLAWDGNVPLDTVLAATLRRMTAPLPAPRPVGAG